MAGRRPDPLWACYLKDTSNPKTLRAQCLGCDHVMSGLVARMIKHADACTKLHETGRWNAPVAAAAAPKRPAEGAVGDRPAKQQTLPVVRTSRTESDELNRQLTRFVVAANVPFKAVDHPEFHKLAQ